MGKVYEINENTRIPASLAWTFAIAMTTIAVSVATILGRQEAAQAATTKAVAEVTAKVEDMDKDRQLRRDQLAKDMIEVKVQLTASQVQNTIMQGQLKRIEDMILNGRYH